MSDKSVEDILAKYDAEERTDKARELIHEATNSGIERRKATPAILVHIIHLNKEENWNDICNELNLDINEMINTRRQLVRTGVIDNKVRRPSELVHGKYKEVLEKIENEHPDRIFDGTSPYTWVAGVVYLDEWLNMRGTTIKMVAGTYHVDSSNVRKARSELVRFDAFHRAYGETEIDGSLGELLHARRYSLKSMAVALSETTKDVRNRLTALENESDYTINNQEINDVTFYWTVE